MQYRQQMTDDGPITEAVEFDLLARVLFGPLGRFDSIHEFEFVAFIVDQQLHKALCEASIATYEKTDWQGNTIPDDVVVDQSKTHDQDWPSYAFCEASRVVRVAVGEAVHRLGLEAVEGWAHVYCSHCESGLEDDSPRERARQQVADKHGLSVSAVRRSNVEVRETFMRILDQMNLSTRRNR